MRFKAKYFTLIFIVSAFIFIALLYRNQPPSNESLQPSSLFENSNPIDDYFNAYDWNGQGATAEMQEYGSLYRIAWENEMRHAYDLLLKKANPKTNEPTSKIILSRDLFIDFVKNDVWIEVYADWSDAFGDESGNYGESITIGTGAVPAFALAVGERYKTQTLILWDILVKMGVEVEFIFEPSAEMISFFENNSK